MSLKKKIFFFNRLIEVCHGQRIERESQLVIFLVFEHLEQDLSDYIDRYSKTGVPRVVIQVRHQIYDRSNEDCVIFTLFISFSVYPKNS